MGISAFATNITIRKERAMTIAKHKKDQLSKVNAKRSTQMLQFKPDLMKRLSKGISPFKKDSLMQLGPLSKPSSTPSLGLKPS